MCDNLDTTRLRDIIIQSVKLIMPPKGDKNPVKRIPWDANEMALTFPKMRKSFEWYCLKVGRTREESEAAVIGGAIATQMYNMAKPYTLIVAKTTADEDNGTQCKKKCKRKSELTSLARQPEKEEAKLKPAQANKKNKTTGKGEGWVCKKKRLDVKDYRALCEIKNATIVANNEKGVYMSKRREGATMSPSGSLLHRPRSSVL
ncbi:hypothetical protein K435DRAFT_799897 [Dendrothele bispora CBS 962.96]|uniref:Uncharacterized protein n=1 Tax=Dendrothele bispora (strain CBS 962.96) TaxID=1314807 RepID=A0A4S8LV16_DENBC|nr:hypothetical protein K435DRAFT_799897 [Dendrothele bispora CBS 962.96]